MSSAHSMNARKCVHAQKPYPSQAFAHESNKVGGRGKREEERQEIDRGIEESNERVRASQHAEDGSLYLGL